MAAAPHGAAPERFSLDDWFAERAPLSAAQRLSVSRVAACTMDASGAEEAHTPPAAPVPMAAWLSAAMAGMDLQEPARDFGEERAFAAQVTSLVALIDTAQGTMSELRAGLAFVEDNSSELMAQAGRLLDEQNTLETLHEQIMLRLSYFSVLPHATALVSAPTQDTIESPAFLDMVRRLELVSEFMASHAHYADASLYQMRAVNCLVRAMSLVKEHFAHRGASALASAQDQLRETNHVRDFASHSAALEMASPPLSRALYTAFQQVVATFRPLVAEMERLAAASAPPPAAVVAVATPHGEDEVRAMLDHCRLLFCQWRMSLTHVCVHLFLSGLPRRTGGPSAEAAPPRTQGAASTKSPADMAAQAATFVHELCAQEVDFYATLFELQPWDAAQDSGAEPPLARLALAIGDQLHAFLLADLGARDAGVPILVQLCDAVQDTVRTVPHTVSRYKSTAGATRPSDSPDGHTPDNPTSTHCAPPGTVAGATPEQRALRARYAGAWALPALYDLRARLLRRVQTGMKEQIVQFRASAEDLEYPLCLQRADAGAAPQARTHTKRASTIGAGLLGAAVDRGDGAPLHTTALFVRPSDDAFATWYVTVRRAWELLAALYTRVAIATFVDTAVQVIDATKTTIDEGAEMLRSGQYGAAQDGTVSDAVDGFLFQVRHLCLIKELLHSVEIASRSTEDAPAAHHGAADTGLFGARMVDAGVVRDVLNSIWSVAGIFSSGAARRAPAMEVRGRIADASRAALRVSDERCMESIAQATDHVCDVVSANITLPLQVYLNTEARAKAAAFSPGKAGAALATFRQSVAVNAGDIRGKLWLYVHDDAAVGKVMHTALDRAMQTYQTFFQHIHASLARGVDGDETAICDLVHPDELRKQLAEQFLSNAGTAP
ncbi:Golgi transport complex subunit 3 [Malassezia sp. CBS 17886]|nr:Golgi transport complex subunit 3 [Malassezia sp. CBS 17886]